MAVNKIIKSFAVEDSEMWSVQLPNTTILLSPFVSDSVPRISYVYESHPNITYKKFSFMTVEENEEFSTHNAILYIGSYTLQNIHITYHVYQVIPQ